VAATAAARPDALAVVDADGTSTNAELASAASRLAAALAERGIGAGDVVSIQLPNRVEGVVAAVAALSLGAVINPLLPNYRARELSHVFTTARPAAVVTPGEYRGTDHRDLVAEVVAATGVAPLHVVVGDRAGPSSVGYDALVAAGSDAPLGSGPADAVSEVIFTSGTEAQPKAIMHTEQTTNFSVRVAFDDLGVGPSDVVWMPSPIGHSTGFNYGVRFALYHGLPLVLQDRWDAGAAAELIERYGCSYTLAATTFLQDLIGAATASGTDLSSLQHFGCGGAPVPGHLVDEAAAHGVRVLRLYGSTEVLVGTWNRATSTPAQRRDTDGLAMTHVELEVRDDDGPVVPGQPGELFTRGPNTCVGFFGDPERTAATFGDDGFVRSGDLVTIGDDGYLTVVGRKKEIIIRGGVNIAPREVEELIVAFPEVERVAVVGLPHERLGELMCACVVLVPDAVLDFDTMVSRLRAEGLATFKLPQRLEVLGSLPTTPSGKIQKHEIVAAIVGTEGR
jgi:acyl-CoA synthetase (AMP-forming)/AMP-acid ligase II